LVGSARAVPTTTCMPYVSVGGQCPPYAPALAALELVVVIEMAQIQGNARNPAEILYTRNSLTNRSQSALGTVPTMSLTASPPVAASR
jgi:hypothetical protein